MNEIVKNVLFWYDLITFLFIQTDVDNSLDYNYDELNDQYEYDDDFDTPKLQSTSFHQQPATKSPIKRLTKAINPSPVKSPSCIYTRASASESSPLDSSCSAKTASYATYDNVKKQTVTVTDPGNATLGEDYGYEQAESATRLKLETNPLALLDNDE